MSMEDVTASQLGDVLTLTESTREERLRRHCVLTTQALLHRSEALNDVCFKCSDNEYAFAHKFILGTQCQCAPAAVGVRLCSHGTHARRSQLRLACSQRTVSRAECGAEPSLARAVCRHASLLAPFAGPYTLRNLQAPARLVATQAGELAIVHRAWRAPGITAGRGTQPLHICPHTPARPQVLPKQIGRAHV